MTPRQADSREVWTVDLMIHLTSQNSADLHLTTSLSMIPFERKLVELLQVMTDSTNEAAHFSSIFLSFLPSLLWL